MLIRRAAWVPNAASLVNALFLFRLRCVPIDAFEHLCVPFVFPLPRWQRAGLEQ